MPGKSAALRFEATRRLNVFVKAPRSELMQQSDALYSILKRRLDQIDPERENAQDLIYEVVGEYMAELMAIGNIPHYLLDLLESDLREEVLEMYRKTTYGFITLRDYKIAQGTQKRKLKARSS